MREFTSCKTKERGAIHIVGIVLLAVGVFVALIAFASGAQTSRLEKQVAAQEEQIKNLEIKVKMLEMRAGL